MTAPWFFHPEIPAAGDELCLDERETRHATGARRLRGGAELVLFDGAGVRAEAELLEIRSREVRVRIVTRHAEDRPRPIVHLASALPKGDRQSILIGMATQLGAASITPLECERSVARCTDAFAERARRVAIESCKQSRQPRLPEIRGPETPGAAAQHQGLVWLADPDGAPFAETLAAAGALEREHVLLIGPEGGFTDGEIESAGTHGARPVRLGSAVLRIETAAVAAVAALRLCLSR